MNRGPEDGDIITGGGGRTPTSEDRFPINRYPDYRKRGVGGGGPCATVITV